MSAGARINLEGTASLAYRLRAALEREGLAVRFVGPPPREQRDANEVLQWIGMYVTEQVVDASLGRPLERLTRTAVDRVVAEFKRRYPNLRMTVDHDV